MVHFIQRHIDRIMAFDRTDAGRHVIHIDYYALVDDPVGQLRAIHAGLGIETPDDVAESVAVWRRDNPKNARGRNDYALTQFDLVEEALGEQFRAYRERFDIPSEREGLARSRRVS